MAKVNLSKAAKLVGKNRTTIWRHIKSGKLSCQRDRDGLPMVDTSELIRVYGELQPDVTQQIKKKSQEATLDYLELVEVIKELKKEQTVMMVKIENLTNRLTYTVTPPPEIQSIISTPENDPDWPKEIKTIADIALRNEIKEKY